MPMSKSDLLPIENTVENHLGRAFPTEDNPSLVVGVSGGADSMCLLHVLHKLDARLHVVHLNYQKRGEESEKDAALVKKISEDFGIECEIVRVNPDEAEGKNFQQWARDVRYHAFEIKAEQVGANGIATAHHQDDQIETVLQKIFRGSGLANWSGMQEWDGRLFRPLLGVSREEIERYCQAKNIPFRTDKSNLDSDYARNFLRNEWLPEMQQYFPGWRRNVLRISEQGEIFASSLKYILDDITDKKDRLNRKAFLQLDEPLKKSVLLYYVNRINETEEISRDALKELSKLDNLQTGKSIQLSKHLELMRDRDHLKLVVNTGDTGSFLVIKKKDLQEKSISFNGFEFALQPYEKPNSEEMLYLDLAAVSWPVRLRRWKEGDRFQPLGMDGHQTVADHLTNRKVSAVEKDMALVLESFEETICAVIFPPIENRSTPGTISEIVKCDSSTRKCLTINRIS